MTGEQFFLNSLFNGLDFNKVSYCVLRNYEKLPNTTGNSDLDILINKKDAKNFINLISEFSAKQNGQMINSKAHFNTQPLIVLTNGIPLLEIILIS